MDIDLELNALDRLMADLDADSNLRAAAREIAQRAMLSYGSR